MSLLLVKANSHVQCSGVCCLKYSLSRAMATYRSVVAGCFLGWIDCCDEILVNSRTSKTKFPDAELVQKGITLLHYATCILVFKAVWLLSSLDGRSPSTQARRTSPNSFTTSMNGYLTYGTFADPSRSLKTIKCRGGTPRHSVFRPSIHTSRAT
ncbi:hypothetical protein AVEN_99157-1 [Araneus ventricosus]|uniref:Uncharacterized protein n=1 Tax=Araneus ventricosus TaxID=182803 RepID=A0A4Y2CHY0_ARAVE|nr:hypothetical protein AVEN_99157-1 [Araneus ventricosus]